MQLFNWMKSKLCGQPSTTELSSPYEWLLQFVTFFRKLGFFPEYAALSDDELARKLESLHENEWGERIDPQNPFIDLLLLRWDKTRVWWEDTEADVCRENKVYTQTLQEWASISNGTFIPEHIQEKWEDEHGPITVTFTYHQQEIQLSPHYLDDYIDIDILLPINHCFRHSGKEFALYEAFDQTAFIVMLTSEEKQKLHNERKWRFATM